MKEKEPLTPGCIVKSLAGRDAGRWFVVLELPDEQYALIADGDLRKAQKPKKKKRKHLRIVHQMPAALEGKIANGTVQDFELRAALKATRPHEEG